MSGNETDTTCRNLSWLAAILLGILAFLITWKSLEWRVLLAFIVGVIVVFVIGKILTGFFCSSASSATIEATPTPAPTPTVAPTAPSAPAPEPVPAPEAKPAAAPAPKPTPAAKPAPAPKPKPAATAEAGPPEKLDGPRGGKGDDLKRIKGVGPGLEKALHGMGVYHFDQIANWTASEIAWVDDNLLRFKGRATRDNWVEQAKTLAEGGETAFSSKVDKGDVY